MAGRVRHWLERGDAFYARISVPRDLREIVGKAELLEHLGRDRALAKRNHPSVVARLLDRLDEARRQRATRDATPTAQIRRFPVERSEIASMHYAEELANDAAERDFVFKDGTALLEGTGPELFRPEHLEALRRIAGGSASVGETEAVIGWAIDKAEARGLTIPRREAARLLAAVQIEAVEAARARDAGMEPPAPRHPFLQHEASAARTYRAAIDDLVNGYMRELQATGKGQAAALRWKSVFVGLKRFLGHDDARRITRADVIRWKDDLIARPLAPKTVRDVHLSAIKAVLSWGVDNARLDANPAAGVKVRVGRPVHARLQGFTDAEARGILQAATRYVPGRKEGPKTAAAKRWTPVLAAYTGARIAELTQLRKSDIREEAGVTYLHLTPDAGSTKTGLYRDVPLHPHVLELGFLGFVASADDGPLFFAAGGDSDRHPSKAVADRVGKLNRAGFAGGCLV